MMWEVAWDGFTRTPEEIAKCKNRWYRWKRHFIRLRKAYIYKRLDVDMVIAALRNRKLDFE